MHYGVMLKMRCSAEILEKFGCDIFSHPIFYNNKIALRFELENPELDYENSSVQSIDRAQILAREVFKDSPHIVVVTERFVSSKREKAGMPKRYVSSDASISGTFDRVEGTFVSRSFYRADYDDFDWCSIFSDIACYRNKVSYYIFCVNRGILFHMYDDRGCDVVGLSMETLRPFYLDFNCWILDFDREQIQKNFSA